MNYTIKKEEEKSIILCDCASLHMMDLMKDLKMSSNRMSLGDIACIYL